MSPRSIAILAALVLQLLQLCGCAVSKPSNAAIEQMERRHEEDMQRMGGGSGMCLPASTMSSSRGNSIVNRPW